MLLKVHSLMNAGDDTVSLTKCKRSGAFLLDTSRLPGAPFGRCGGASDPWDARLS